MKPRESTTVVDEPFDGATVARLLHDRAEISHATAKGLVAAGGVRVNDRPVSRPDHRLSAGDRVTWAIEPGRRYKAPPGGPRRGEGYRLVEEDAEFVVVDKDPGVLSVPVPALRGDSLVERLTAVYTKRGFRDTEVRAVHRIDRFTSGLVAFSRSPQAHANLRRQFATGSPERVYLAVAEGRIDSARGHLAHDLVEHAKSLKVSVARAGERGRRATLKYRVLERMPEATLLEVTLETGRRNQIRVQFAAEGHPLVGDLSYGHPSARIDRVALHAARLAFDRPRDGRRVRFEAEPPADFKRLLVALRRGAPIRLPETNEPVPEAPRRAPRKRPVSRKRAPGRRSR